jgi:glycosyltransferase involved in cell wall biosynthesis
MSNVNYLDEDGICIIARNYANPIPEGRTQASINLVNSILASGVRAKIFSLGYPFKITRFGQIWHLGPNLIGVSDGLGLCYPSIIMPIIDSQMACLLSPFLRGRIIYILNVSNPLIFSATLKVLKSVRQSDAKVVAHILEPILLETRRFTFRQYPWLLKRQVIDYALCINHSIVRQYSSIMGDERVYFVPYPVDTSTFQPRCTHKARKALNLPLDAHIVGFIGHIELQRGIFDLLKAFAMLRTYDDTLLAVVPSPFTDMRDLQGFLHAIEKMDLRKRVKLLCGATLTKPFYANTKSGIRIESFYNAVDIMVLPFRRPYYVLDPPAVIVETLSSGIPLITTPVGAIKEIVGGERGLLIEPGNVCMLKDALEYLLNDEKARRRLGLNAREYVTKNLSLEVVGQRIRKIFEDILSEHYKKNK